MSDDFHRHYALKPVAAMVATAGMMGLAPQEVFAQKPGQNTTDLIAKADYGLKFAPNAKAAADKLEDFDPAEKLKGKKYILVQGYNGCQFCDKIGQNLGKIRAANPDVPIVVINVKPEDDRGKVEEYAAKYKEQGVFKDEADVGKTFFLVFPKSRAKAVALQEAIEASFNRDEPESHGLKITAVNEKGVCTAAALGTVTGAKTDALVDTITKGLGGRGR